jgi:hypothetical protein
MTTFVISLLLGLLNSIVINAVSPTWMMFGEKDFTTTAGRDFGTTASAGAPVTARRMAVAATTRWRRPITWLRGFLDVMRIRMNNPRIG